MSLPPEPRIRPSSFPRRRESIPPRGAERARRLGWLTVAAVFTAAALAACGGSAEPTPTPVATPTPALEPTATATSAPDSAAPAAAGWRSDIPIGPAAGDRAPDATITLPDGQTTTLQELAAGKPMLLYFFATW